MAAEKNFENRVKNYLKEQGAYFVKYWGGGRFTKSGIPDILACINGCFIGIEIKADNGKPSVLQLKNLRDIENAEGYGVLLYPEDFDTFKQFINEVEKLGLFYDSYIKLKGRRIEWEQKIL